MSQKRRIQIFKEACDQGRHLPANVSRALKVYLSDWLHGAVPEIPPDNVPVTIGETHQAVFRQGNNDDSLVLCRITPLTSLSPANKVETPVEASDDAEAEIETDTDTEAPETEEMFSGFSDSQLMRLGVSRQLLPAVRKVNQVNELLDLSTSLSPVLADRLLELATGAGLDEILGVTDARHRAERPSVETDRLFNGSHTGVLETDRDIELALSQDFEDWQIFLWDKQLEWVRKHFEGPAVLNGGAGTGKTVILLHRARHLAREVFTGAFDRILILTYTTTLRDEIHRNLDKLCGKERGRIEVLNIHKWAQNFLSGHGFAFNSPPAQLYDELIKEAAAKIHWDVNALQKAYEGCFATAGAVNLQTWLAATSANDAYGFTKAQLKEAWTAIESLRERLLEMGYWDYQFQLIQALTLIRKTGKNFAYRSILVDECQDMGTVELKIIRALVPEAANDLFLVGDPFQRIFSREAVLSECGIDTKGRFFTERINYRTTNAIGKTAESWLGENIVRGLDGGTAKHVSAQPRRQGTSPIIRSFSTFDEEASFLQEILAGLSPQELAHSCLMTLESSQLERYRQRLDWIETTQLTFGVQRGQGLQMCSMRRSKGLEFLNVFLVGVNEINFPSSLDLPRGTQADIDQRRRLLYVAASRARNNLYVTSVGELSGLLGKPETVPVTVLDTVKRASRRHQGVLEFLPSAFLSAEESPYVNLNRLTRALDTLADLADRYFNGGSCGDWGAFFENRGLKYSAQESQSTTAMHSKERTFNYGSRKIYMERHLKLGSSSNPSATLRIHFESDAERKVFLVGHVGKHLPIASY